MSRCLQCIRDIKYYYSKLHSLCTPKFIHNHERKFDIQFLEKTLRNKGTS